MKRPDEITCQYCGLMHKSTCPRIRAIEYHPNGTIKRVEFIGGEEPSLFKRVFGSDA